MIFKRPEDSRLREFAIHRILNTVTFKCKFHLLSANMYWNTSIRESDVNSYHETILNCKHYVFMCC